jgi:hypothetical protein
VVTGTLVFSERAALITNQPANARTTTMIAIPTVQSWGESAVLTILLMKGTSITRARMMPGIIFFMSRLRPSFRMRDKTWFPCTARRSLNIAEIARLLRRTRWVPEGG